jgi:hypothetical protein
MNWEGKSGWLEEMLYFIVETVLLEFTVMAHLDLLRVCSQVHC